MKQPIKLLIKIGTISSVIDMMRYDMCFPATEEDSRKLERAQMGGGPRSRMDHLVKFLAVSQSAPTEARWRSFGCEVLAVGEKAVNKEYERLYELERDSVKKANKTLTKNEAMRLHEEAPALTVKELRRLNKLHFGSEFLSSADKKTIVRVFRQSLDKFMVEATKS